MTEDYEVVIGIETHVQLGTRTKLFCGCNNDSRDVEPNTNVCPVCLGLPGSLPVLNHQAIKLAMRAGLALGHIFKAGYRTKFDRKNYFYPDLPNGYQITQFDQPIVGTGEVQVIDPSDHTKTFTVGITRAHLEADAGKLTHPDGANYSLVDLNRASTPLIEIVSEPDIGHASIATAAARAKAYAVEINNLMRYAEVSDANLYYGNMRFDVNVSVRKPGQALGTRTETKNLNSFKSVEKTVEYEAHRQIERIEKGERIVQETRGFDDTKQITFTQRSKEDAMDYRYFPEPDIPPVVITDEMIDEAKSEMSYMPADIRKAAREAGIAARETQVLVSEPELALVWHQITLENPQQAKFALNWLIGDQIQLAPSKAVSLGDSDISSLTIAAVGELVSEGKLSSTNAKLLLSHLWDKDEGALHVAQKLGLLQQSDSGQIEKIVDEVIAANPQPVADIAAGKQQAMGFLVGQVMKQSKGQANPGMAGQIIKKKLGL